MKKILKIFLYVVVFFVLLITAILFFTSGDRDTARNFAIEVTSGQTGTAYARLHSGVQAQISQAQLADMFAGAKPITDVSFTSVETSGGASTLLGTSTTVDGCASEVEFRVLDEQIVMFNITPLCR